MRRAHNLICDGCAKLDVSLDDPPGPGRYQLDPPYTGWVTINPKLSVEGQRVLHYCSSDCRTKAYARMLKKMQEILEEKLEDDFFVGEEL